MESETEPRRRLPRVYEYSLPGGWRVLAGKTDVDNDLLTLAFAHPRDLWFHVLGLPGSHVIMEAQSEKEPDRETLRRAAAIAAYHSKARNGGLVTVLCTEVRFVKKPPRAKPGSVQVRKETLMKVRPALPPQQP